MENRQLYINTELLLLPSGTSLKAKEPITLAYFWLEHIRKFWAIYNLFGDTNAVHISVDSKGYSIDQIIDGETVAEVLDYVQYNAKSWVLTVAMGDFISKIRILLLKKVKSSCRITVQACTDMPME